MTIKARVQSGRLVVDEPTELPDGGAGAPYPQAGIPGVRRVYVGKVACHLYYTFDEHEVIVRAFWGARRRRGPRLSR